LQNAFDINTYIVLYQPRKAEITLPILETYILLT